MIYFVQANGGGPIKIGVSRDPESRFATLRGATHEELRLLAVVDGCAKVERDLHAKFADERIRGEWFTPSPALLAFIAQLPQYEPAGRPAAPGKRKAEHRVSPDEMYIWRYEMRWSFARAAKWFSVETKVYRSWEDGNAAPPNPERIRDIMSYALEIDGELPTHAPRPKAPHPVASEIIEELADALTPEDHKIIERMDVAQLLYVRRRGKPERHDPSRRIARMRKDALQSCLTWRRLMRAWNEECFMENLREHQTKLAQLREWRRNGRPPDDLRVPHRHLYDTPPSSANLRAPQ